MIMTISEQERTGSSEKRRMPPVPVKQYDPGCESRNRSFL
jgi:hypothetical protein